MAPKFTHTMTEQDPPRPRKKQRLGSAVSSATATSNTRAKFAFGSRLPDPSKSFLRGPKSSGKNRLQVSARPRNEHNVQAPVNPRKRRRSISDDSIARTMPTHGSLAVKTALPLHGSQLPAPTKVSEVLSGGHLHTISPPNPVIRNKKRNSAEQKELVAELAATGSAFWIKRREKVEAALKELDAIEKRIMAITK